MRVVGGPTHVVVSHLLLGRLTHPTANGPLVCWTIMWQTNAMHSGHETVFGFSAIYEHCEKVKRCCRQTDGFAWSPTGFRQIV